MIYTEDQCLSQIRNIEHSDDVNKEALFLLWHGRLGKIILEKIDRGEMNERKILHHGVNVGDVFCAYLGSIPLLFEVIELHGNRKGFVREVFSRKLEESYVQGHCIPMIGRYCGESQKVHFSGSVNAKFPSNAARCKVSFTIDGRRFKDVVATFCEPGVPLKWAA